MRELCDSQKFWLEVLAAALVMIGGLVIPIVGPYLTNLFTQTKVSYNKPSKLGWLVIVLFSLSGCLIGAYSASAETKACNRVDITAIACDSSRGDKGVTEVVTITNNDDHKINLDRWKLCDYENKHCYTFQHFELVPQTNVQLWTGMGVDTLEALYWNSRTAIWDDGEDTATLTDNKGRLIDQLTCPPLPTPTNTPSPTFTLTPSPTTTFTTTPTDTITPTLTPTLTASPTLTMTVTPIVLVIPVAGGTTSPTYDPLQGVTAICKDGTYSYSQHRQGTCAGHGGVKRWIHKPPN